jgi:hypothetical protein
LNQHIASKRLKIFGGAGQRVTDTTHNILVLFVLVRVTPILNLEQT